MTSSLLIRLHFRSLKEGLLARYYRQKGNCVTYIVMERLALGSGLNRANPNTEISESLTLIPFDCVSLEQGLHDR